MTLNTTIISLKEEREAIGLTPKQMAAVLGMTVQAYSRVETGARALTKIHLASLRLFLFIVARDGLLEFLSCLEETKILQVNE